MSCTPRPRGRLPKPTPVLMAVMALATGSALAQGLPQGGTVVSGAATINQSGAAMTVTQQTDRLVTDWQRFSVGQGHTLTFVQPSASAVALNRVIGSDASVIQGALRANGHVFLVNPNGVLFSPTAEVNVGGLVASTLSISNEDFLAGRHRFSGGSTQAVVNQGHITGSAVAFIAARVVNQGDITAPGGTVALGAGRTVVLDLGGPVKLEVQEGALEALISQGGAIRAPGGIVYLAARSAGDLAATVIRHTGTTEAQTLATGERGQIMLLGGLDRDRIDVGGVLDASAPSGGDGGFIETSAARVILAGDLRVTTAAPQGRTGTWLIDPQDFTIAATGGDMTGAQLTTALTSNNVTIESSTGQNGGAGDLFVNDAVNWSAHTLTLTAARDIRIQAVMTANGTSSLVLNPGTANGNDAGNPAGVVRTGATPDGRFSGRVDFGGRSGTGLLTIGGQGYTVINTLGAEGSTSGTDLQGMRGDLGGHYALGSDIDASATAGWTGGFRPVGDGSTAFSGQFDGLGHTISGLTIDRAGQYGVGLFGLTDGAQLRNVGLSAAQVTGGERVGAVAGFAMGGRLHNVFSSGNVQGDVFVGGLTGVQDSIEVSESRSFANVTGDRFVGGLAGFSAAWVLRSYATGDVTGTGNADQIGGLTGANTGALMESYATGNVIGDSYVGGLTGYSNYYIANTYATGAVTATGEQVGGLVGHHGGGIYQSYASGAVSSPGPYVGGLTGYSDNSHAADSSFWDVQRSGQATSSAGRPLSTADLKTRANFTGPTPVNGDSHPGWDMNNVWTLYEGQTTPLLQTFMTPLTVSVGAVSKTYDGQAHSGSPAPTYSSTPDMTRLQGTLTVAGTAMGATEAGTYTLALSGLSSDQHGYLIRYLDGTLTIDPRPITVTAANLSKTYGTADPALTYLVTQGSLIPGDSLSGSLQRVPGEALGSYLIDASQLANSNYLITAVNGTLSINGRLLSEPENAAIMTILGASRPAPLQPATVTSQPTASAGSSTGLVMVAATDSPPAGSGSRDAAGFMRVLVVSGGIKLPTSVSTLSAQEAQ